MVWLEVGSSNDIAIGTDVIAMGYALGLPGAATLTTGVVSAKRVDVFSALTVIQTDTVINPGNSGGPLMDLQGRVVGINTAKIIEEGVDGINLAIAIDDALPFIGSIYVGNTPPSGTDYTNPLIPLSFAVPEGWQLYELFDGAFMDLALPGSSGEIFIQLELVDETVTTDQYAQYYIDQGAPPSNPLDNYLRIEQVQITISGTIAGWAVTEEWKRAEIDYEETGKEVFFIDNGIGYRLYSQSASIDWDTIEAMFDSLVDSINIGAN